METDADSVCRPRRGRGFLERKNFSQVGKPASTRAYSSPKMGRCEVTPQFPQFFKSCKVVSCLRMGTCSEKCILKQFHHHGNIAAYTCTHPDGTACCTPRPCAARLVAPRLHACATRSCTKHEIRSRTRVRDVIERSSERET